MCIRFLSRTTMVVLGLAFVLSAGCSSHKSAYEDRAPGPLMPSQASRSDAPVQPVTFEAPPVLDAEEVLSPELYKGQYHVVKSDVYTYGLMNDYVMDTDFGTYDVVSDEMLRIRVQETQALAALEEISKTKEFGKAVGRAGKGPFVAVKNLILHPADTISGVPKGLWRFTTRLGEMAAHRRGELEESRAKEFIMFSQFKRQIAYQLDVDVYSSNSELQKKLNSVAWASYAGGMTVNVSMFFIPAPVGFVVRGIDSTRRLNLILRDSAPEDLRRMNRKLLVEAGFDKGLAKAFVHHPWFSPRHKTFIVDALVRMEDTKNRDVFLRLAMASDSEEGALLFQRIAEMMQGYDERVARIQKIVELHGLPLAYTNDQRLVLLLVVDYGVWSQLQAGMIQDFSQYEPEESLVKQREIRITGRLSQRSQQELVSRGIALHERSYMELQPPPPEAEQEDGEE